MEAKSHWDWEIHPIALLLMILAGFAAIDFLLHLLSGRIWDVVWNMPSGIGALLGSFSGLIGIAVSAWLGFTSLRHGQEHAARLARKQIDDSQALQARAVAGAMYGELQAIREQLQDYIRLHEEMQPIYEQQISESPIGTMKVKLLIQNIERPIFLAHVSHIGLLPTEIAHRLSFIHGQISGFSSMEGYDRSSEVSADLFVVLSSWAQARAAFIVGLIDVVANRMKNHGLVFD